MGGVFGRENFIVITKKYPREKIHMKKRSLLASTVLRLKVEIPWRWPKQGSHDKQLEFKFEEGIMLPYSELERVPRTRLAPFKEPMPQELIWSCSRTTFPRADPPRPCVAPSRSHLLKVPFPSPTLLH